MKGLFRRLLSKDEPLGDLATEDWGPVPGGTEAQPGDWGEWLIDDAPGKTGPLPALAAEEGAPAPVAAAPPRRADGPGQTGPQLAVREEAPSPSTFLDALTEEERAIIAQQQAAEAVLSGPDEVSAAPGTPAALPATAPMGLEQVVTEPAAEAPIEAPLVAVSSSPFAPVAPAGRGVARRSPMTVAAGARTPRARIHTRRGIGDERVERGGGLARLATPLPPAVQQMSTYLTEEELRIIEKQLGG
ncbi:MAG: hypothetical protein IT371_23795 [Deltaproteobacteria bacterium]|nr:hypothetical protein [Deltaproteobacteria bacterium]